MKLPFRVPYRWLPRTFWGNVWWIITDLWGGVCNVFRWAPVIWFDADFDWSDLAKVMEYKLRRSAHLEETVGHHLNSKRDARNMRVCADLLKRLRDDEYFENAGYRREAWATVPAHRKHWIVVHSKAMQKQDQRYLGLILGKYLTHWWD